MSSRPRQTADVERGYKPPDQQVFRDFGAGDDGPMPSMATNIGAAFAQNKKRKKKEAI